MSPDRKFLTDPAITLICSALGMIVSLKMRLKQEEYITEVTSRWKENPAKTEQTKLRGKRRLLLVMSCNIL
jgi:hypothetical protein